MKKYNKNDKKTKKENPKEKEREAPPPKARPSCKTLAEALSSYRTAVSPTGDLQWFLNSHNIPVVPVPDWSDPSSDHQVTHVMRDVAQIAVFRDAVRYTNGKSLVVQDRHGRSKTWSLPKSDPGVGVSIVADRPREFAADLSRAPPDAVALPVIAHVGMYVDIYGGHDKDCALDPQSVAVFASETLSQVVYIVEHNLTELYGSHEFVATKPNGESTVTLRRVEGCWESTIRDGVRLVSFTPGPQSTPYPLHPYAGWLSTGATEVIIDARIAFLHCHLMSTVGPYRVWKCALGRDRPEPVNPVLPQPPRYESIDPTTLSASFTRISQNIYTVLPPQFRRALEFGGPPGVSEPNANIACLLRHGGLYPIDRVVCSAVAASGNLRAFNGRVIQSFFAVAERAMEESPLGPIRQKYASLYYAIFTNSVVFALANRPDDQIVGNLAAYVADQNHEALAAISSGKHVPSGPPGWLAAAKFLGAAALAVLAIRWLWKRGVRSITPLGYVLSRISECKGFFGPNDWRIKTVGTDLVPTPESTRLMLTAQGLAGEAAWLMNPNHLWNMVATKQHLIGTVVEEAAKYILGPWATSVIIGVESIGAGFAYLTGSAPQIKSFVATRGSATLLHVGTAVAYKLYGAKAMACTIPIHWAHNFGVAALAKYGLFPYQASMLAYLGADGSDDDYPPEQWARAWTAGHDDGLTCVQALPHCALRASPCNPTFPLAGQDWRAENVSITVDGVETERWDLARVLSVPKCAHQNLEIVGSMCASCVHLPPACFVFPLIIQSGQLYQPLHDGLSMVGSVLLRDFADPFGFYSSPKVELAAMEHIAFRLSPAYEFLLPIFNGIAVPDTGKDWVSIEECAAELGGFKGQALIAADVDVNSHGQMYKTKVQTKYNETVKASGVGRDGDCFVKPRSVKNVSTQDQTSILPVSRCLSSIMKSAFDGNTIINVGPYAVRFVVAHATDDNMQRYADLLENSPEIVVVISCDDTIVSTGRYAQVFGFGFQETDYTSYDQSQSEPFWACSFGLTERFTVGRRPDFVAIHRKINTMPVKGVIKDPWTKSTVKISASLRCCMRTGVGTTSDFGSLHNLIAHVSWLLRHAERPCSFASVCAEIGLEAKVVNRMFLNGMTFLKGWYCDGTWNVMVSCVLKLGKVMKDPCVLLKLPPGAAHEAMFSAIMSSVKVPDDYPLVGAYVQLARKFRAHASPIAFRVMNDANIVEDARYKVRSAYAGRAAILSLIEDRYGLSATEVEEAERLILSVNSLPALVCHPVFSRLRAVDYT